jgi:hypothetical protein
MRLAFSEQTHAADSMFQYETERLVSNVKAVTLLESATRGLDWINGRFEALD